MNYCCIIVAIKSLCVKLMQSFILMCIYLDRIILYSCFFFFSGLGLAEISRIFKLCKPLLKVNRSGKNFLITITQTLP